ncbi:MAG: tRNA uridine-5-carboxymethylaminomethyl(34) synthesis GTPase MnmE [Lachnospiraceae bacterium]|nr:tRNA uridine-5-carboxymethylaminomethyl(34) synthesis GTPase MnmE [Lachnospiraceae bacterium]
MMNRTIAAIATAVSPSGVGIIRVSGDDAFTVIKRIFKKKSGHFVFENKEIESHVVTHGFIYDDSELIDEVLVLTMKGPHTYTGEDTVEIDCHGGVLVMKKILETVIKYGASPAEPGEFSKRAFLNGKMDLSQAESVIDLINSSNEFARENSLKHLSGVVKDKLSKIRAEILHEIAFIESALDDPEHYSLDTYPQELRKKVELFIKDTNSLLKNADNGRILKEGIKTVIVGKPNVGKSSFLNALIGEDRAIVTDVAGTTRDVLTETITFDGITLNIVDTAGIRDTDDFVEKIGVEKSKEYMKDADLILFLVDATSTFGKEDQEILNLLENKKSIVLLNKIDLGQSLSLEQVMEKVDHKVISISAKEQIGLDDFINEVKQLFFHGEVTFNDEVYITGVRQKQCLISCYQSLTQVLNSIDQGMPEDFFSIDLMNAYTELGNITGESVGEDLVNEIFSKFCMGK